MKQTTGSCHCGAIEYTAEVNPDMVGLCHCTDCQIMGGGPCRFVALVVSEQLKITKGDLSHYDKVADSGSTRRMAFCGVCGTQIYSAAPEADPNGLVALRATTCALRTELRPAVEIWCDSRLPWFPEVPEVKMRRDRQL